MTTKKIDKLKGFSLKLSDQDIQNIKLILATNHSFKYQYQLFDCSIMWALEHKDTLQPIATPRNGKRQSCYLSIPSSNVIALSNALNCTQSSTLYTALVNYIKTINSETKDQRLPETIRA